MGSFADFCAAVAMLSRVRWIRYRVMATRLLNWTQEIRILAVHCGAFPGISKQASHFVFPEFIKVTYEMATNRTNRFLDPIRER